MTDQGRQAAQAHIDTLPEPRHTQMQHLFDIIAAAIPEADIGVWDYSGTLIGFGSYEYSNSRGPAGRWFSVGLANRKAYISLYSMAAGTTGYLVEEIHDRFPGTKIGRSCINISKPEAIEDAVVADLARVSYDQYKDGFTRLPR